MLSAYAVSRDLNLSVVLDTYVPPAALSAMECHDVDDKNFAFQVVVPSPDQPQLRTINWGAMMDARLIERGSFAPPQQQALPTPGSQGSSSHGVTKAGVTTSSTASNAQSRVQSRTRAMEGSMPLLMCAGHVVTTVI